MLGNRQRDRLCHHADLGDGFPRNSVVPGGASGGAASAWTEEYGNMEKTSNSRVERTAIFFMGILQCFFHYTSAGDVGQFGKSTNEHHTHEWMNVTKNSQTS
jgi:hypothetical protein